VGTVPIALVIHLLVVFPSGRARTAGERALVVAAYAVSLVLQVPLYLFAPGGPLQLDEPSRPRRSRRLGAAWSGAIVVLLTCLLLVRRLRAAAPAQRRVLAPLSVYGILAVLAIPAGSALANWLFEPGLTLPLVQLTIMAGIPVAFAVGVLRGGFARTADVEELGAWLGAEEDAGPAGVGRSAAGRPRRPQRRAALPRPRRARLGHRGRHRTRNTTSQ
jgi:hypothetical protein